LYEIVNEHSVDGSSQEIFIDRDGAIFRHVLIFIRHGKVFLPANTTKEEFIMELGDYGIHCEYETCIHGKSFDDTNILGTSVRSINATETIKLNVGGHKYEVLRSVIYR